VENRAGDVEGVSPVHTDAAAATADATTRAETFGARGNERVG